ncbi:MAG: GNAT family N-acetyltransferase [Saprospirales bacterium]|jgi:GNAT superfamily N-acetyltransferase|nr:GNAT family N-acetyltransferase [Saprospirales bacterium]MBK8921108.1 GNAT family N-acetyltransferase [Saprospirales bacterium]
MSVQLAETDKDILKCRAVLLALRPHLAEDTFLTVVREQLREGYQLAFIEQDGQAVAAIGFRYLQFLFSGKHFYIDDLSTLPQYRGRGYGGLLLDFVTGLAREKGYAVITLDSGFHRHDAHRLYLSKGFKIASLHFSKSLNELYC